MSENSSGRFYQRRFDCPSCGSEVTIPRLWCVGVESVFSCPNCKQKFKTGYKVGALLFGLSLTAAIVTANLLVYIFSSSIFIYAVAAIVPLWLFYGFLLRRWWLLRRARRDAQHHNSDKE